MKELFNFIERLSAHRSRVDLVGATAAGVSVGLIVSLVGSSSGEPSLMDYTTEIFLAIAPYLIVASLSQRFWPNQLKRFLPVWLLTAFFGSVLFIVLDLTPRVINGWYDPFRMESSLLEYIVLEFDAARSVVMFFTLITIPITATFHHAGNIIRGVKAWHQGQTSPGILNNSSPSVSLIVELNYRSGSDNFLQLRH